MLAPKYKWPPPCCQAGSVRGDNAENDILCFYIKKLLAYNRGRVDRRPPFIDHRGHGCRRPFFDRRGRDLSVCALGLVSPDTMRQGRCGRSCISHHFFYFFVHPMPSQIRGRRVFPFQGIPSHWRTGKGEANGT
jgi:hypothetical protein